MQQKIVSDQMRLLGQIMGVAYQDVVKACIEGDWGRPVSVDNGVGIVKLVH